jgi:hypothetical protein
MKYFLIILISILLLNSCSSLSSDASIASKNLSTAAENFEINRRVVFYNGITDKYILIIEGRCSVDFYSEKFTVTVKTGPNEFKKHYLGKADNVFPFVEQLESSNVDTYHYRVIFKPSVIKPNIEIK